MPKYQVTTPRFWNDSMHGPGTGRNFITTDKPISKDKDGNLPEGLVLVTKEEKKAAPQTLDKSLIKKAMIDMIQKKEGCTPEGIPTMKPLKDKTKLKFNQDVRDEIMVEITQEKQNNIEKEDVTFTTSPSAVQTLS